MKIEYTATFLKQFQRLSLELQDRFRERLTWFQQNTGDSRLRTHSLKGNLRGYWAFSVNQSVRATFKFETKTKVTFVRIGSHDVSYR